LVVCLTDRRTLQHLTVSNGFLFSPRASFGRATSSSGLFDGPPDAPCYGFVDRWFRLLARRFAFRPGRRLVGAAEKKKKKLFALRLFVL
jgi:hypothetical protein